MSESNVINNQHCAVIVLIVLHIVLYNYIYFWNIKYPQSTKLSNRGYYVNFLIRAQTKILIPKNISYVYAFNEDGRYGKVDKPGTIFKRYSNIPLKYDIFNSFRGDKYFVLPNLKGMSNRLQLFSGLYIISCIHKIPIICECYYI